MLYSMEQFIYVIDVTTSSVAVLMEMTEIIIDLYWNSQVGKMMKDEFIYGIDVATSSVAVMEVRDSIFCGK
eukprot:scaffold133904_cov98-Attheya_sp.AAC.1